MNDRLEDNYEIFIRINIATFRIYLREALEKIKVEYDKLMLRKKIEESRDNYEYRIIGGTFKPGLCIRM